MANDKNNTNELVSDDDSTAELEALTFRQDYTAQEHPIRESDENTCNVSHRDSDDARTIGKLQYDIEQLRARWLGLEAEIKAREELNGRLNAELDDLRGALSRKDKQLKTNSRTIRSLKAEVRERHSRHQHAIAKYEKEIAALRNAYRSLPDPPDGKAAHEQDDTSGKRLVDLEAYADTLRRKLQDVLEFQEALQNERDQLANSLSIASEKNRRLENDIAAATEAKNDRETELAAIGEKHAEEIRILRFELGAAQETVVQTEELNSQLASDLVDTRGFKNELERMLCDSDEQSQTRIAELEKELAKSTRAVTDLEQKLEARSDAINVLLAELARKSEQVESIGEIGDVISDIDVRISEQFDELDESQPAAQRAPERVTRVLVGKIGAQLLRFPLFKDRLTIGRTADNDIQLNAAFISRRHAVVQADGGNTRVIDWGSKNGVFVNSARVTEHFLKNGDIVTIGNAHFRYEERTKRDG